MTAGRLRTQAVMGLETEQGLRVDEVVGTALVCFSNEKANGSVTLTVHLKEGAPGSVCVETSFTGKLKKGV